MKVLLVDDEPLARMLLREYLAPYTQFKEIIEAADGFTALKMVQEEKPDLLLLDVQMPKLTGLEVVELLPTPVPVIFTTAFEQYAVQAFEAAAVDYLLKPIAQNRFNKAIDRFLQGLHPQMDAEKLPAAAEASDRIAVRHRGGVVLVPVKSIIYLQAEDDMVRIITPEQEYLKTITLTKLEQSLPKSQFVRVHRSVIVNLSCMKRIVSTATGSYQAEMSNGQKVSVSDAGYARLRN